MVEHTKTRRDLFVRRCLACGYDGVLLQGGDPGGVGGAGGAEVAECCELCGCDFILRPPRSYAEMEGLDERPISTETLIAGGGHRQALERWLTFAVLVLVGLGLLMYLGRAALP